MSKRNKTLVKRRRFCYNYHYKKSNTGRCGGMADTRDLKSLALKAYEFESR